MINVGELRIGNIVNDEDLQPMYIAGLWPVNDGKQYNFKDSAGNSGNVNILSGIPLTEEWLLKFGFVKLDTSDIFYILGYNMQLKVSECLTMVAWHNLMLHDVKIEYVHQLMNLYFALTGEELCLKP